MKRWEQRLCHLSNWSFRAHLGGNQAPARAPLLPSTPFRSRVWAWTLVCLTKPHLILFESCADMGYWILFGPYIA